MVLVNHFSVVSSIYNIATFDINDYTLGKYILRICLNSTDKRKQTVKTK